ncbi:MAG: long-chain fatty acid--CoA ligase [Anaerolineae bacterium]
MAECRIQSTDKQQLTTDNPKDVIMSEFIEPQKYTMDALFGEVVKQHGHRPALAFVGEQPFTYAEFGEKVAALQAQMEQYGLKKGDKVVLLGPNSPNWAVAYMAVTTFGTVAVPVMDEFPESDVEHTLGHSEAKAIFIDEGLFKSLNLPSLEQMLVVFNLKDFSLLNEPPQSETLLKQVQHLPEKIKKATGQMPVVDPGGAAIHEDDLAEILYTSGTTGHSKGVMLTHKNLVSNTLAGAQVIGGLSPESVLLGILPLAHAFGCTSAFLTVVYSGGSIYFLSRKPSPKVLMSAMQQVRPTLLGAVPLVFEKIYHKQVVPQIAKNPVLRRAVKVAPLRKLLYKVIGKRVKEALGGRLDTVVIGGAGLAPEVETFMREGGLPYLVGYGMSECAPLITASTTQNNRYGSCGYAIRDVQVEIFEPNPETGTGEILVKGPNVMQGYFKNEAETRKVFTNDGWLITGDRGYLDADGYLYIKGRSKNVIIGPSGENIYPEIIEDKLKGSPYVEEALVYELDGKIVARVYPDYLYIEGVVKGKDEAVLAAEITRLLEQVRVETNAQLPSFSKIQEIIEQRMPFLKTPTNKIKRAEYIPNYGKARQ